jgi:putative glutamine amidotransferase
MSPLILVTSDHIPQPRWRPLSRVRPGHAWYGVSVEYTEAITTCGGTPLIIPPGAHDADALVSAVDGLLLPGGHFDVHPSFYNQKISGRIDRTLEDRTALEIQLIHAARAQGKPILGICGGMQVLAVAMGGSLIGDLPAPAAGRYGHEQPTDPSTGWHDVKMEGMAAAIFGDKMRTNSTHHQAVDDPGEMRIVARASDGVIEAVAATTGFALGVQWHPEQMGDCRPYQALIDATISQQTNREE